MWRVSAKPSAISRLSPERGGGGAGTGPRRRISATDAAEKRNETASSAIVNLAPIAPTKIPASPGPLTSATEVAAVSRLFASTRSSRSTSRGRLLEADLEEDRAGADGERDDEHLPELEDPEQREQRDEREQQRPSRVRRDQQRAAPVAVDLYACGEREQHERDRLGEPERAHLAGARIELLDREERQRQQRHLRPDRGHRLAGPEPSEVAVSTKQHLTDYFQLRQLDKPVKNAMVVQMRLEPGRAQELRLAGERLCLDFANTLDPRHGADATDFLTGYSDLATWAGHAGALAADHVPRLVGEAERRPDEAEAVFERARGLREAVYRSFAAIAGDAPRRATTCRCSSRPAPRRWPMRAWAPRMAATRGAGQTNRLSSGGLCAGDPLGRRPAHDGRPRAHPPVSGCRRVRLALLRHEPEPQSPLVPHGELRQPRQGPSPLPAHAPCSRTGAADIDCRAVPVNEAAIGKQFPPFQYEVGKEKIAEYAHAVGEDNPVYFERDRAKEAGFRDVPAPPMFAVVYSSGSVAPAIFDPDVGINFAMMVHGGQEFVWASPSSRVT